MKSLQVLNGDIVLNSGRRGSTVVGKNKLVQDLKHWLLEPIGTSPNTATFGSKLSELLFTELDELKSLLVKSEITRVLELYKSYQFERVRASQQRGELSYWSKQEILSSIISVDTVVKSTSIRVIVRLQTLANTAEALQIYITPSSVTVL